MPATSLRRLPLAVLATALLVVPAGGSSLAADAEASDSFCGLLPLEELHALSALRYGEPMLESAEFCAYDSAPEQVGPHSVLFYSTALLSDETFAEMRETVRTDAPGIVDVDIAGQPGYIDASDPEMVSLVVGLDDGILTVETSVAGSAEAGDTDAIAYSLAVGESLVPKMVGAPGPESVAADSLNPPAVEGVDWDVYLEWAGTEIRDEASEAELGLFESLLDASGSTFEDMSFVAASGEDAASGDRLGSYLAFRFAGADATALTAVVIEWAREASAADEFDAVDVVLSGHEATELVVDGETVGHVHARGDRLFLLELSDELTARLLELLP
jgi:hypothetical protein